MLIKLEGKVIESLKNLQFLVELEDKRQIRCYTSGKMRLNRIKVLVGDQVIIELDDSISIQNNIGRIIRRT